MAIKKRIVLFFDGTWNESEFGGEDTNIARIASALPLQTSKRFSVPKTIADVNDNDRDISEMRSIRFGGIDYVFFYERGVGTGFALDPVLGGVFRFGLDKGIRRAYKFLARYYKPSSEIFVFGFSRGAYTARSLVGYLTSAGLLRYEHCTTELEGRAWRYYKTAVQDRAPGVQSDLEKYTHSVEELRIDCLGLFDTVGSLGLPAKLFRKLNRDYYDFHEVDLSPIVKLNLHALAIDEARRAFAANVWRVPQFMNYNSIIEQTWFPGVHSDVGGGYYSAEQSRSMVPRGLHDAPLDWMWKRLRSYYRDFPELVSIGTIKGGAEGIPAQHDSFSRLYRPFGKVIRAIGNVRPSFTSPEKVVCYTRGREAANESIHISALQRLGEMVEIIGSENDTVKQPYIPMNVIVHIPNLWEKYCGSTESTFTFGDAADTSITAWSGETVTAASDEQDRESVQSALRDACSRLRKVGRQEILEQLPKECF